MPIPVSMHLSGEGGENLARTLGLTAQQLKGVAEWTKRLESEQEKLARKTSGLAGSFHALGKEVEHVGSQMSSFITSFGTGGGLSGILKSVGELNKKMFDLSKTAALTGQSFSDMKVGINDLTAATLLSKAEATTFFKTVSEGTRGVRMTGEQVSKLGKTLSQEFGPSLENVTDAFQKLAQIQEKDIFLFQRLESQMDPKALQSYAAGLIAVNKISQDQLNTLFRTAIARQMGEKAQSREEQKMLEYQRTVQSFNKAWQDLTINIGAKLLPVFAKLEPIAEKMVGTIDKYADKLPALVAAVGALVAIAPAMGAISLAANTIGGLVGGVGGVIGKITGKGAGGKRDGQSASTALHVTTSLPGLGEGGVSPRGPSAGGLGGEAASTGRQKGWWYGKGMGMETRVKLAGGGMAAGLIGQTAGAVADATGHERIGAGAKALGGMAQYGMMGMAVGGPIGAVVGGLVGLVTSLDDVKEALFGTKSAAKEAAEALEKEQKDKKKQAEKARLTTMAEAEKTAGESMTSTRFGAAYATSKIAQERLMAQGMSQKQAEEEAQAASSGMASQRYLQAMKGVSTGDIMGKREEVRAKLQAVIPDDDPEKAEKIKEQLEAMEVAAGLTGAHISNLSLLNLIQQSEQIKALFDSMNQSLETQASVQLELYADVEGAQSILRQGLTYRQQELALMERQRDRLVETMGGQEGIAESAKRLMELRAKSAELTAQGLGLDVKETAELADIERKMTAIQAANANVATSKRSIASAERQIAAAYDRRQELESSQLSLMEAQAAVAKEMYLGAGPTLEFQIGMVQQAEKMKEVETARQADLIGLMKNSNLSEKGRADLQLQLNQSKQKELEITQKQLALTKNLREGYLDALTTMTNAEGTFAKFVLRKEMGMGELQRNFLAAGGMRTGMIGAGGEGPSVRWRAGGGPGALQFLGPQAFAKRAQGYGEEMTPGQTIFPNVPSALAQTPLGQFGAQAPESGATGMGGRAGPGITIQNPLQAAELRSIEKETEERVKKGEGTADLRARGEAIVKEAYAGTFENQVLGKMDQIIAIISGGKPPTTTETKPIQQAVEAGVAKGQAAVSEKKEQALRQEATKQAAEMRRGTNIKGAPTAAEAAMKSEAEKLDESEKLEKAKFEAYTKSFNRQTGYTEGVDTRFLGIGKGGGPGAKGVAYAGAKGMTVEGAKWETPATAEQIKAVSLRGGGGAVKTISDADLAPVIKEALVDTSAKQAMLAQLASKQAAAESRKESALDKRGDPGWKTKETDAEKSLKEEQKRLNKMRSEEASYAKKREGLVETSDQEAGFLSKVAGAGGDIASGLAEGASTWIGRPIGKFIEQSLAPSAKKQEEIEQAYDASQAEADKETITRISRRAEAANALAEGDARSLENQKKIAESEQKIARLKLETAKDATERKIAEAEIAKATKEAYDAQAEINKIAEERATIQKDLAGDEEKNRAISERNAAAEAKRYKAVIQKADIAAKAVAGTAAVTDPKRETGIYMDGQRQVSARQVAEQEKQTKAMVDALDKQMADIGAGMSEAMQKGDMKKYAELETQFKEAFGKQEAAAQRLEKFKTGAEVTGAKQKGISGTDAESLAAYEKMKKPLEGDEFAKWKTSAEGQKQLEAMNKVHAAVKEGTKVQQEVGQAQADAQKEAGQNLKSTLEQQKIDVTPVVTNVNPACATAVAQTAATGGWIAHMASGGKLPGFGGGDRVLALLEPGEFVVNKNAAAAFPGLLDSINKNRFQAGGMAGMAPSPSMARQGGTISPRFNISVRGDTAKALVGSVSQTLSGMLNDMFTPQGTSGRLFDLGT